MRQAGARVVFTDFQRLGGAELRSPEAFYRALGTRIARDLRLEVRPDKVWDSGLAPNFNFEEYIQGHVLDFEAPPLLWALDEVDRLFTCDFGGEVFGLLRSWHNARSVNPGGPWSTLTIAISYATEAHLFIKDLNQSPFNVGTLVALADFDLAQVAALNRARGEPLRGDAELGRFYQLIGGHPYLTNRGLYEMARQEMDIAAFEARAPLDDGLFGGHLRRALHALGRDPELQEVMRGVLKGHPCPSQECFYRLRAAGLLRGDSARDARPRCRLHELYLARHLA
jgi:hypothetical protein